MLLLLPISASAKEPEEYLDSLSESIPPSLAEGLPDVKDGAAVRESVGVRHLFELLAKSAASTAPRLFAPILSVIGLLVLFSLFHLLREGFGTLTARIGEVVLSVVLILMLYDRFFGVFTRAGSYLSDLSSLASAAAPVMGGLYLAGGNAASAAASGGVMAGLSLLLDYLVGRALLPLLRVMMGFLLVSSVGEVRTEGVAATLRTLYITVLGFFSVLLVAAEALGSSLATAGDSFTLRSLRFAVGQMVPVVGGAVSGSLGTALASVALVRSTAGATVAAAVLLPMIPLLLELFLSRLALSLLSGAAGMLSLDVPRRLIGGFRALFDLALASVAFSGLVFLFVAASFARTLPAM